MDLRLTPEQELARASAHRYATEVLAPRAARLDREAAFPAEAYADMAAMGWLGMNVPAELGGSEAGPVAYALVVREVARACASTAVGLAVTNMVAELLGRFGETDYLRALTSRVASGEAIAGAFALSEASGGSDPRAGRTRAHRRGGRWVIEGSKQWITSGGHAGVILVFAQTGEGMGSLTCFAVERGAPGLTVGRKEDKMGLRGSETVELRFDGVQVDDAARLGAVGQGFNLAMVALDGGRIGIGAQALGLSTASLEAARDYLSERKAFGQRLGDFQAMQWLVADMATSLEAATLLVMRAACKKEARVPFTLEASMAKLMATETANTLADRAVHIHGGNGYVSEFPVERLLRDARAMTIYEGTSEIQRVVIAREVLRRAG